MSETLVGNCHIPDGFYEIIAQKQNTLIKISFLFFMNVYIFNLIFVYKTAFSLIIIIIISRNHFKILINITITLQPNLVVVNKKEYTLVMSANVVYRDSIDFFISYIKK